MTVGSPCVCKRDPWNGLRPRMGRRGSPCPIGVDSGCEQVPLYISVGGCYVRPEQRGQILNCGPTLHSSGCKRSKGLLISARSTNAQAAATLIGSVRRRQSGLDQRRADKSGSTLNCLLFSPTFATIKVEVGFFFIYLHSPLVKWFNLNSDFTIQVVD